MSNYYQAKKITIGITYQIVSPESCENGDFEETGFEVETRPYIQGDIRQFKNRYGGFYSLENSGSNWWQSYDDQDYRSGNSTSYSIHIKGITDSTKIRIDRYLTGKKIFNRKVENNSLMLERSS